MDNRRVTVRFAAKEDMFLFFETSRLTLSPTQPPPPSAGTGFRYKWLKRLVRKADHSTPFNFQVKNEWRVVSTSPCAFMACAGIILCAIHAGSNITLCVMYYLTSLVVWWSELLTTNHEVRGSIPGSAVRSFPCRRRSP
jgi:hypothetical protein